MHPMATTVLTNTAPKGAALTHLRTLVHITIHAISKITIRINIRLNIRIKTHNIGMRVTSTVSRLRRGLRLISPSMAVAAATTAQIRTSTAGLCSTSRNRRASISPIPWGPSLIITGEAATAVKAADITAEAVEEEGVAAIRTITIAVAAPEAVVVTIEEIQAHLTVKGMVKGGSIKEDMVKEDMVKVDMVKVGMREGTKGTVAVRSFKSI